LEPHSQLVHHFHACDRFDVFRHVRDGGRHVGHALDGEGDIGGGKWSAVRESYSVAQFELPCRVVDHAPRCREIRPEVVLRVHRRKCFEQVRHQALVAAEIVEMRVDGVRLDRKPEPQVRRHRGRDQGKHRRQQETHALSHDQLTPLPEASACTSRPGGVKSPMTLPMGQIGRPD
jgi:hypothetical protein